MGILEECKSIIEQRQSSYGHPRQNHLCTAQMFSSYLWRRFGIRLEIDAVDVCYFNILQKISREANKRSHDAKVDIAGYSDNAERCDD